MAKYKVVINNIDNVRDLLQQTYDLAEMQIVQAQNEINKLINSTNLGSEDFSMDDKAKYFKAIHDLTGDKKSAIQTKLDIVKFMGEMVKHSGDAKAVVNDKAFAKRTSLNLNDLRNALKDDGDDTDNYTIKKN